MSRLRQLKIGSKPSPSTTIHAKLNATNPSVGLLTVIPGDAFKTALQALYGAYPYIGPSLDLQNETWRPFGANTKRDCPNITIKHSINLLYY